jgi:hypothetical protein
MNIKWLSIAYWFSLTRELESQRDQLRERVRQLEVDNKLLVDGFARAAHKEPVFERVAVKPQSSVPSVAFGPSAVRARRAAIDEEAAIIARAEVARNNGHAIPDIPSE